MDSYVYDTAVDGASPAIGKTIRKPASGREYMAGGPTRWVSDQPQILTRSIDDVTAFFGPRTYAAILTDPAASSSYDAVQLAIVNGPIQVLPAVRPKGYRYQPPASRRKNLAKSPKAQPEKPAKPKPGDEPTDEAGETEGQGAADDEAGMTPEEAEAHELAEFAEREIGRLKPLKATLLQALDCMGYGCKLAEVVREVAEDGPDKGKLVLKALKVKPDWAWRFVVDSALNVVGVLCLATDGGYVVLPPEKFAVLTWKPKDGDPRGTSILRAAYDWWNIKQQIKPHYYAHLSRFGSPSLDGELSADDTNESPAVDPATGHEIPGETQTASQRFFSQLVAFANNTVIVRAAGSKLNVLEPKSNGEAFLNAVDLADRQMSLAIGLQTRTSQEAKHGSKADGETAENTRGLLIDYGRELASDWLERGVLYQSIKLNYGKEAADRATPCLVLGQTEAQDMPARWSAAASLGYQVGPSQMEEMDADLGLPRRDAEADAQHAADAQQREAEIAARFAPAASEQPPGKGKPPPPAQRKSVKP